MFIAPKNIRQNRLLKNRTLNFDTVKRTDGNLVFILTDSREILYNTIKSPLLRPQQMMRAYSPRIIRPLKRGVVRYDIAALFSEIKEKTGGKIMHCKVAPTLFAGKNLLYDITNEYNETAKMAFKIKSGKVAADTIRKDLRESLKAHVDEVGYEKAYLIIPFDRFIENFRMAVKSPAYAGKDPLVLVLKDLRDENTLNDYKIFERIFIYNNKTQIMMCLNPHDGSIEKYKDDILMKLGRINNFNGNVGGETLEDDVDDVDDENISEEDYEENVKQNIKDEVFKRVAKQLKANKIDDFEDTTKEEKVLAMTIDKKIDEYLNKPENLQKPFNALVDEINNDPEIKVNAIKYVEHKRVAYNKNVNLSKTLEKELSAIDKVSDILDDESSDVKPEVFNIKEPLDMKIRSSTLPAIDKEYNTKCYKKDINNIIASFSQTDYLATAIDSIEYEDTSDDFNKKETVKVKYKTDEGQALSFVLDIPKIVDDHYMYIGGNKWTISKQLTRLPIVKTKADRVEISTSYNKMTIERRGSKVSRRNAYLLKILKSLDNPNIKVEYADNTLINADYDSDFEYEELAAALLKIEKDDYTVLFNRQLMEEYIEGFNFPTDFINENRTPLAYNNAKNDELFFIENEKVYRGYYDENKIFVTQEYAENMFDFILNKVLLLRDTKLPSIGKAFLYTTVKFLKVTTPILTMVGMMNGLTDILKRQGVEYQLTDKRADFGPNWVEIKFKDKFMYYKDKMKDTILLNALYVMDTEKYNFLDFETDDPYLTYLVEKLGQPMYAKNMMMINLSKMIDPITKEVLIHLKQPTNIIDLLLLANNMLADNKHLPLNDMRNFRVRGNETIPAVMYEIISTAIQKYQKHKMNGNATNLKINRNELISKLNTLPNINTTSVLNPVLEIENAYALSAKGHRGINLGRAYTLEMRSYDDTMAGLVSGNSTSYSGNVGISRGLVFSPDIDSTRGYIKGDTKNPDATKLLSLAEILSPFTAAQADAPRAAMQVAQTKHTIPTVVMNKQLFGSGINKELAYMISDDFCFKAKQDGIVEEIDNANKLAILLYDDGTRDAIDLNETLVKNSNSGFFVKQTFLIVYKQGERFKKNDVVAYNPKFFEGKGNDIDFCPGTLAKIAVTAGDFAFEDATVISESLSKKCATKITMAKPVALGPRTIINNIKHVGDEIESGESLLDFVSSDDELSSEILQGFYAQLDPEELKKLSQEEIKSKYSGTLVDIQIYYNKPFNTLSPSLQKLITAYNKNIAKRKEKISSLGIQTSSLKLKPTEEQTNKKIEGTEYDGVLIIFFIEYLDEMGIGDKLTFQTALKGVVSKVFSEEESPISEYRSENNVEAILTPTGVISRMTLDIYSNLYINKVLIELGQQIKEIWNE